MIALKHFVIILFNLKLYRHDKAENAVRTEEWTQSRFKLFERFCLPSVKGQTERNFIWLCFFDESTPVRYRAKIEEYRRETPQLTPVYLNQKETDEWKRTIQEKVTGLLDPDDRYVITTNLDNDDCLHREALRRIQQAVLRNPQTGLYVFPVGLQYFIDRRLTPRMTYPHNHFMSLCEERGKEPVKTIKFTQHGGIRKKYGHIVELSDRPYWIETVHERNVANSLRVTSRVRYSIPSRVDWEAYGLNGETASNIRRPFDALCAFVTLYIATGLRKIGRKIGKRIRPQRFRNARIAKD